MTGQFWSDDRQWERLRPVLPKQPTSLPRVDDWRVTSGIVHVVPRQHLCLRFEVVI